MQASQLPLEALAHIKIDEEVGIERRIFEFRSVARQFKHWAVKC